MTNDYVIDGGLTTGEPQACADLSLGGSIRSDITPTNDGGGLDDTSKRGWNESSIPQDSQSSYAPLRVQSCLRPTSKCQSRLRRSRFAGRRHYHMRRGLRGQAESNSIDHSDRPPRRLHFGRCGLAVPRLGHDDSVAVFCRHPRPEQKAAPRLIARTRLFARLASWVAQLATSLPRATLLERSCVSARTRALPA